MYLLVVLAIIVSNFPSFAQKEGDIQLDDGILEIFYNGTWGTVCDDSFDDIDAQVACRQLGYNNGYFIGSKTKYEKGKIWLDDVDCSGAENKLSHCTHTGWGVENCFRGENVQIECNNASEGEIKISSGKLEILHNNEWGTVCSSNFGKIEADVACKQLGYRNGNVLENTIATGTSKIWLNKLECYGGENELLDCSHTDWGTHNCSHGHVVGIRCVAGDVRINSSRLEVYYNETWGTVCDDSFDDIDASVACRQLGFSSGISLGNEVDDGTGTIWLDDMQCSGNEQKLSDCPHRDWGEHNCGHSEDVGIECINGTIIGKLNEEGDVLIKSDILKIFHNNEWGTVCYAGFDNIDATVACRQLGYRLGDVKGSKSYDFGKIWLTKVNCTGGESNLASCPHAAWGKHYCYSYVKVACNNETSVSGDIRILSGRLEIFHDFAWGTVYYGHFDDYAAEVACRQLGHSTGISLGNIVDDGSRKIWLDDIKCTGEESKLTDCVIKKWGTTRYRSHSDDVGIRCSNDSTIINGNWSVWTNWSECSKSCGNGIQTRSRRCYNPPLSNIRFSCHGDTLEAKLCNKNVCPVIVGNWSLWTNWTDCSRSCGNGIQRRSRKCNDGLSCKGDTLDAQLCNKILCPVDGRWGLWSIWNICNVTCGGGKQWRFRHCNNPTPLYGGSDCGTDSYDFKDCNIENCPGLESSTERIGKYISVAVGCIVVTVVVALVCQFVVSRSRTQNKDQPYTTALKTGRRAEGQDRADDCIIIYRNDGHDDD